MINTDLFWAYGLGFLSNKTIPSKSGHNFLKLFEEYVSYFSLHAVHSYLVNYLNEEQNKMRAAFI